MTPDQRRAAIAGRCPSCDLLLDAHEDCAVMLAADWSPNEVDALLEDHEDDEPPIESVEPGSDEWVGLLCANIKSSAFDTSNANVRALMDWGARQREDRIADAIWLGDSMGAPRLRDY